MEQLKIYFKNVAITLVILCGFITGIGALSTGDVFFIVCAVVFMSVWAYKAVMYIKEHSGQDKK